jgi:rubrerythrin
MKPTAEALRAIETAIRIEEEGVAFYTEAAQRVSDPKGRRMFESLAADEAAHLMLFTSVRTALVEQERWLTPAQVTTLSPARKVTSPLFRHNGPTAGTPPQRELEVLRRGIQAEEESIALYTAAAEQTDDPDGRAMYEYLVEQEKGHRTLLEGEYDYLTQTGFWFDVREFGLETAG